jgi:hypothetical protein
MHLLSSPQGVRVYSALQPLGDCIVATRSPLGHHSHAYCSTRVFVLHAIAIVISVCMPTLAPPTAISLLRAHTCALALRTCRVEAFFFCSALLVLISNSFIGNHASAGAHVFLTNPYPLSMLDNCSFSSSGLTAIIIQAPIQWYCRLGLYMQSAGTFPGNFSSCLFLCPAGYVGGRHNLTAPTGPDGCSPCWRGFFCPEDGTSEPLPCPTGTHMPALGASEEDSCIRLRPAIELGTSASARLALLTSRVRSSA